MVLVDEFHGAAPIFRPESLAEQTIDLPGLVAFQAALESTCGPSFGHPPGKVVLGRRDITQAAESVISMHQLQNAAGAPSNLTALLTVPAAHDTTGALDPARQTVQKNTQP
jgi:hypothetical protein